MMKTYYLLISLLFIFLNSNAQCDKCLPQEEEIDYCFKDARFEDLCAQFVDKNYFYFNKKKKSKRIDLNFDDVEDIVAYRKITNNKKLKLTANDLLFIQMSVSKWNVEKKRLGYEFLESGLGIKIIKKGGDVKPVDGKTVVVHYVGYLMDGEKFDSSRDRGQPFQFQLGRGRVIKGWDEGVKNLTIGTRAMLMIPPELGYGSRNMGPIPANSTLIFDIEVLDQK
ncbi:FKBP-type peptidyl-prolyl cis-trans isomerase [Flammeovirga yaeyamensis]|uniref:Peptidyl-prolyl cis-trans isomerase n=1 Tax=Flammeovirga yaeyamensis TaxID=367791 RepID=A0AAX1N2Z7_9BACT|nr:FKBP-type peptidyl-prolyl cis-trans isomerase [Flammeovirga yaeyamensis]MBB3696266.1 FKBP-type peptidyl-prolyl cis-trans isomerase [Flammeovirga yaeyamensis]QWG00228.1 FKBP-type peptidyl-prolyl cis-trans isomerase [Flammeovirga yaeyamensis]